MPSTVYVADALIRPLETLIVEKAASPLLTWHVSDVMRMLAAPTQAAAPVSSVRHHKAFFIMPFRFVLDVANRLPDSSVIVVGVGDPSILSFVAFLIPVHVFSFLCTCARAQE